MTARGIAIAVIAAGVIAGGVALAIAVNGDAPDPEANAHDQVNPSATAPTKPAPTPPPAPPAPAKPAATSTSPAGSGSSTPAPGRELPPVAREQERLTRLEERTNDPNMLTELLGQRPTGFMLATIGTQVKVMRDAVAAAQAQHREGKLSDEDALRAMRAAEATYRALYQRVTGLSDAQVDLLFPP